MVSIDWMELNALAGQIQDLRRRCSALEAVGYPAITTALRKEIAETERRRERFLHRLSRYIAEIAVRGDAPGSRRPDDPVADKAPPNSHDWPTITSAIR